MEVIVPIRLISALTLVRVPQASPESTVGLLFHAASTHAKMVVCALNPVQTTIRLLVLIQHQLQVHKMQIQLMGVRP